MFGEMGLPDPCLAGQQQQAATTAARRVEHRDRTRRRVPTGNCWQLTSSSAGVTGPRALITVCENCSLVGADGSVAGWGLVAQGGVPSAVVVVEFPVADQNPGLGK